MPATHLPLMVLMLTAGLGIPVMAALNANLGAKLGNPVMAVVILCLVASIAALLLLIIQTKPSSEPAWRINPAYYVAGVIFVAYIASMTYSAPRMGLGNAVFFVILGQLISAAVIDHNGWLGVAPAPVSLKRGLGLVVIALGVYLARANAPAGTSLP